MHHTKLEDHKNGVTTSRKGNRFKFTSPIPGLHIYDNIWPEAMKFIERSETEEFWQNEAEEYDVKWVREDYLVNEEFGKRGETCWIHYHKEIQDAFGEVVDSYLAHWNIETNSRETFRITKFSGNGEFFGVHSDDSFATPRTVSLVYYPTDDYDGGELEFIHFGVKIKPKAGQLFLFPSAYNLEHRVHEITRGTRITFVCFFNQLTSEERLNRQKLIKANEYYQPRIRDVLDPKFMMD